MRIPPDGLGRWLDEAWSGLTELVLPAECAGCRTADTPLRNGVCAACVGRLQALRPAAVRPTPSPPGMPPCVALGPYQGVLREALLAYKERGRHGLARPLGRLLAEVVADAVTGTGRTPAVLLVPAPSTAAAVRARHGDHLRRLVRHLAARLGAAGWQVRVARGLRALPRPDSAGLTSDARLATARAAIRLSSRSAVALRRAAAGRTVILVDDVVTTGATLTVITDRLAEAGVRVYAAAVLAATVRRAI